MGAAGGLGAEPRRRRSGSLRAARNGPPLWGGGRVLRARCIHSHARYIPISHSLTRLRLLYSHSPQIPLPTNPFGELSWGGMPQTLLS
eukprot:scaffold14776_cov178-Isochrysis_galbana.AAC.1